MHEFLIDWDGEQFFDEILGLIKVCQITEFKEIYDTILSQVEQHFPVYTLIDKVIFAKQGRGLFTCSSIIKSSAQDSFHLDVDPDPGSTLKINLDPGHNHFF